MSLDIVLVKTSSADLDRQRKMGRPRIYLDTNVLKFSATELPRSLPVQQEVEWCGRKFDVVVHQPVEVNPNLAIPNSELLAEAELLPRLAEAGKRGAVTYVMQIETLIESWGLPNMDSKNGHFYGARCESIKAPIPYDRVIADSRDTSDLQFNFLAGLKTRRFVEIQKMTGAYQGAKPANRNQLVDAFQLWCAEFNACTHFLTLDFTLVALMNRKNVTFPVAVVRPSTLLGLLSP